MYKEKEQAEPYSFLEYAAYVAFFPQLVAGPIVTHDVLVPQLKDKSRKSVSYDYLSKGIALFTLGLAKKVLLADVFGNYVNLAYEDVDKLNSTSALLAMLGYTLQIYFDFSGYSDMAIGLAWMMRIDLPVNFNSPYISQSVREFWKRWHMTLTAFLTKYVYFPLGGSRVGTVRTYINILIVFLVSGLWHGAGWTFVIWGFLHGMMQVIERMLLSKIQLPQYRIIRYLQTAGSWLFTFAFVNVAWILFRANDMQQALAVMKKIILFDFGNVSNALMNVFSVPEFAYLVPLLPKKIVFPQIYISSYFVAAMLIILLLPNAKQIAERCVVWKWTGIAIAFLLTWCVFSFAGVSTFIYFNF